MTTSLRFVVLDIETLHGVNFGAIRARGGGFKPWTCDCWTQVYPAQVCAVSFEEGEEKDRLSTTINWGKLAPPLDNPYCKHLTQDSIDMGVSPNSFFEMLSNLCQDTESFVGYNVGFDMGCLRHHAAKYGRPLPEVPDVCLMDPAKERLGLTRWPKLVDAYRALCGQEPSDMAHDAEYDVHMTCEVMKVLVLPARQRCAP